MDENILPNTSFPSRPSRRVTFKSPCRRRTPKRHTPPVKPLTPRPILSERPPNDSTPSSPSAPQHRRNQLLNHGAKAHLVRVVIHSLNFRTHEMHYEVMLHALPAAHLHALYARGRMVAPGGALLHRAELEERELARLDTRLRKGLGRWGLARVVADERRVQRIARGLLREFVEREGIWDWEGDVVRVGVVAMARRIDRVRAEEGWYEGWQWAYL